MEERCSSNFWTTVSTKRLIARLRKAGINYSIDAGGLIHYFERDIETIENDLICSLRNQVFPTWSLQSCPPDWVESYRIYMRRRDIPFKEELHDGALWFLTPGKFRPFWKLDPPSTARIT